MTDRPDQKIRLGIETDRSSLSRGYHIAVGDNLFVDSSFRGVSRGRRLSGMGRRVKAPSSSTLSLGVGSHGIMLSLSMYEHNLEFYDIVASPDQKFNTPLTVPDSNNPRNKINS